MKKLDTGKIYNMTTSVAVLPREVQNIVAKSAFATIFNVQ